MNGVAKPYPAGLLEWAGHRAGGVRRLFDDTSGRPSGSVVRTSLLERLDGWTADIADDATGAPHAIFLVGGPGNGKTEGVETIIVGFDQRLQLGGALVAEFRSLFSSDNKQPVPRRAGVDISVSALGGRNLKLVIVQDASATDIELPDHSPAKLLIDDIKCFVLRDVGAIYVACVNRGVLDDALALSMDEDETDARGLLEAIVSTVSLSPVSTSCWPLDGYPKVAIWPMDVESLLTAEAGVKSVAPAEQLLDAATNLDLWPGFGKCQAGERCPFCTSRELLSGDPHRSSLLGILRLYELATGKRWSFRDLFSLLSFLLAGVPSTGEDSGKTPCEWAARLIELDANPGGRSDAFRLRIPFLLVAAQYQHALFGRWPRFVGRSLRADLKELRINDHRTLGGLAYFLGSTRGLAIPATLAPQLSSLCDVLDPAIADSDGMVEVSARTAIALRELDTRFSHSVGEGFQFIKKYQCLTPLETDLLRRLDQADELLSQADVHRRRPATAFRVQKLVRDFACRLVRRSLGVRSGVVREFETLSRFRRVIEGDEQLLHDAVKQVEGLLNDREHFVVTLNTTFGESLPPESRRAVLRTPKQRVKPRLHTHAGRPTPTLRFLSVGDGTSQQSIPLTYELFRSVRELKAGMLPASLPRTVVALLDTTRARLAGRIVRNEDLLDGSEISLGLRDEVVVRELGKFVIRHEGEE